MHAYMEFENYNTQIAQNETPSLLDEILSVLKNIQVARGLLLDPCKSP